jgi:polysaccharide chain length determinant protein (PEP-CTERM system associated)
MQPTITENYGSTSRRQLDVEDYIDIVRRHKAWILGPAFCSLVLAVVVAFLWPDTFVSQAVIRVVPPQVPESYVPTNVNMEMSQRINSMAQTILSRGNLTNIINTFNLYPRDRQRKPMEDVVEQMKSAIKIGSVTSMTAQNRGVSAFSISYSYDNRIQAQKVAADLVARFMSENTRDRTTQSVLTTQFLKDQSDSAKKELETIEDRLAKFRQTNAGRLPDQLQNNQILLNAAESRIANINANISRVGQEKMLLETELRTANTALSALKPAAEQVAAQASKNEKLVANEAQINQAEQILINLKEHYRDAHPDVRRMETQLASLKKIREKLVQEDQEAKKAESEKPVKEAPKRYDAEFARNSQNIKAVVERLEAQIKLTNIQTEEYIKEMHNAEQNVKAIRSRIESEPVGEQQYAEVIRDREVARLNYETLNRKRSQSAIAEDLEKRQQGESLEVLDPASLPQTPTEPKRPMLIAIGTGIGLILGLCFAGAREAKDASLKNLKDVRAYTQLTILGSVPLLENDLVVRRRKRLAWLAWSTACLVGIIIMTGSVFFYYTTRI